MNSLSCYRRTHRCVLFLLLFACSAVTCAQAFADELTCDLFAFKVAEQSFTFGSEIEVMADCIDHGDFERALLGSGEIRQVQVREISGIPLAPTDEVKALTFGKNARNLRVGQRYRIKGKLMDGLSFGGGFSLSLDLISHEELGASPEENPTAEVTLIDLPESVGQEIDILGTLWSLNGVWWLSYGEKVYLTDSAGRSRTFKTNWHGRKVRVRGLVRRQLRASLDQISLKTARDLAMYSVIANSSVSLGSGDKTDEGNRFRALYSRTPKLADGVFELIPEPSFRRNLMGTETQALLFCERNWPHIQYMVKHPDVSQDVIASRLIDTELAADIRLLYAGILAARGDRRGADYLRSVIQSGAEGPPPSGAIFVLGDFQSWTGSKPKAPAEPWLEELALHCLRVAPHETIQYSSVPGLLADLRSQPGIDLMVELLMNGVPAPPLPEYDSSYRVVIQSGMTVTFDYSEELLIPVISAGPELLSSDVLIKLEAVYLEPDYSRRLLFRELLARDDPRAVELFLKDIATDFWSMDLSDCDGPKVIAAIRRRLTTVKENKIRNILKDYLARKPEDAAGEFARQLIDPTTPLSELNSLSWELLDVKGGKRYSGRVARVLMERVLPKKQSKLDAMTASMMIARIGASSDPTAIDAMIELLSADFSNLTDEWVSAKEFRHLIAGCLAEMTGESFGTDAKAWRRWNEANRNTRK